MSKKKPHPTADRPAARAGRPAKKDDPPQEERSLVSAAGIREVVESIVIAFVLAFLFRTFEAEAFVIPTGSMAPTLMGRHKDVVCDQCGYQFQVSASDEVNQHSNRPSGQTVIAGTCPICRHTMYLGPDNESGKTYRSYKGDRILVGKFAYEFSDPERWDVVVFKYPEEAQTNFIKRLVGLPGETVRITHGDVFVKREGEKRFAIARKPPHKIRAMLQPVYDNDYVLPHVVKGIWPARWQPGLSAGWVTEDGKAFRTEGKAADEAWLRYEHRVPSFEDWRAYFMDPDAAVDIEPQLISDFNAYNTETLIGGARPSLQGDVSWFNQSYTVQAEDGPVTTGPPPPAEKLGLHWVGDLAVEAEVEVNSDQGELILQLVEGGRIFESRIDLATGKAALGISGLDDFRPTAATKVQGAGTYRLRFANVDDQLVLWVNGKVVSFEGPGIAPGGTDGAVAYELPQRNWHPQEDDLAPVRIGARQADLEVEHLRVFRDIYYIAQQYLGNGGGALSDFDSWNTPYRYGSPEEVAGVMSDPNRWDPFAKTHSIEFTLKEDQFFMLGDNSAESKDSRLWGNGEHYVSRELLIGKALLIYWPHSLDRIPGTNIPIRFFPNFWRMGLVR